MGSEMCIRDSACPECKGFGNVLKYDEALVVPDRTLSLSGGAVEPWTHPSGRWYQRELLKAAKRTGVDPTRAWEDLGEPERAFVYEGDGRFPGINGFFEEIESYRYKLHVRVFLSRYRSQSPCPICRGTRLKPPALAVRVAGLTIAEFTRLTIEEAAARLGGLKLTAWEAAVGREILRQLGAKLTFLLRVWRAARPSGSTSPTSSAPSSSARSTCSTSRRSASRMVSRACRPITSSSWGRARASAAARSSSPVRRQSSAGPRVR